MFLINDDMSIHVTRGDIVFFTVCAEENDEEYTFVKGDVVRFKAFSKKNCENVVLQKDFLIEEETTSVNILLTKEETKFGELINKPLDYWYEVELNPFTNPQTIIGYDEDGAKVITLYPEGKDVVSDVEEEDIPVVDSELSMTSTRPIQNQAVTRAMMEVEENIEHLNEYVENINENILDLVSGVVTEKSFLAKLEYDPKNEALEIILEEVGVNE